MHTLRSSKQLVRLVLVWFVLFVGAGVVSAAVTPGNLQMVCTGAGTIKLVDVGDPDGPSTSASSSMDCPLCATVLPPAFLEAPQPALRLVVFEAPIFWGSVPLPVAAAPPLPPRGPPFLI